MNKREQVELLISQLDGVESEIERLRILRADILSDIERIIPPGQNRKTMELVASARLLMKASKEEA